MGSDRMSKGSSATVTKSVKEAKKHLTRFIKSCQEVPQQVLEREAGVICEEARALAPYKTGKLENSIRVRVSRSKYRPGINISASARSSNGYNYAGIQHENTRFRHPIKGRDHFLSIPYYKGADRIINTLRKEITYK